MDMKPKKIEQLSWSILEFCAAASIGRTKAYAEIKAGRLTVKKCGSRTIVPVKEAEAWIARLSEGTSRPYQAS